MYTTGRLQMRRAVVAKNIEFVLRSEIIFVDQTLLYVSQTFFFVHQIFPFCRSNFFLVDHKNKICVMQNNLCHAR